MKNAELYAKYSLKQLVHCLKHEQCPPACEYRNKNVNDNYWCLLAQDMGETRCLQPELACDFLKNAVKYHIMGQKS